jgi:hypothetical protein
MEKIINDEDELAILVDADSRQKSSQFKNFKRSKNSKKRSALRKPVYENSRKCKKPSPVSISISPNNSKSDSSNADDRLTSFMMGDRSIHIHGEEHFYEPDALRQYTLEEIGQVMGVTRERVRQVEEVALRKMWRAFDSMSRRENISPDEWIQILTDSHASEETVYLPS